MRLLVVVVVLSLLSYSECNKLDGLVNQSQGFGEKHEGPVKATLLREGRQLQVKGGIDFSTAEFDPETGKRCILKEIEVDAIDKSPILECTHKQTEQCHYTYVTKFTPTQEQICEEIFQKKCQISFKQQAVNETVEKCYKPIEKVCNGQGSEECRTIYESSCTTKYIEKQPGKFVGDSQCEKLPVEICGKGCVYEEGEEECHNKVITALVDTPEEVCDLNPSKICRFTTKLVPRLTPEHECTIVPKESCHLKFTNPKAGKKPLLTKWCLDESEPTPGDSYDEGNALGEPLGIDARNRPSDIPARVATPTDNTPSVDFTPAATTIPSLPGLAEETTTPAEVDNIQSGGSDDPTFTQFDLRSEDPLPNSGDRNPSNAQPDLGTNNPNLEIEDYETEIVAVEDISNELPTPNNAEPRDNEDTINAPVLNVFTEQKAPGVEAPQSFYGAPVGGPEEDYDNDVFANALPIPSPISPAKIQPGNLPSRSQGQPSSQIPVTTYGEPAGSFPSTQVGQPSRQLPAVQGNPSPQRPTQQGSFGPQGQTGRQGLSGTQGRPAQQGPFVPQTQPGRPGPSSPREQAPLLPPVDQPGRQQPSRPEEFYGAPRLPRSFSVWRG